MEVIVAIRGFVVVMIAVAPLGTPADQFAAVFQSVLVLPFQILSAELIAGTAASARTVKARDFRCRNLPVLTSKPTVVRLDVLGFIGFWGLLSRVI